MTQTACEPRRVRRLRRIFGETRPLEQLRREYELEKRYAARLMASDRSERAALYTTVYDEYLRAVGDGFYGRVAGDAAYRRRQVATAMKLLQPYLRAESVYLELGPGDCDVAIEAAKRAKLVYAVDVSREITAGLNCPENFRLVISDGVSVPVPAGSVDLAYSNQLLEHVHPDDAEPQLRNVHAALRPGGVYICRTPNALSGPHDISAYFDDVPHGFHLKEYTFGELRRLFRRVGFRRLRAVVGGRGVNLPLAVPVAPLAALETALAVLPRRLQRPLGRTLPVRFLLNIQLVATK
jgi:SAM-dependent methyltransferase